MAAGLLALAVLLFWMVQGDAPVTASVPASLRRDTVTGMEADPSSSPDSAAAVASPRRATESEPGPTIERTTLDFDRDPDPYAMAHRALSTSDQATLFNAFMATLTCTAMNKSRTEMETELSVAPGDMPQLRRDAIQLVLTRCRGFFDNDRAANRELMQRLSTKIRANLTGHLPPFTKGTLPREHFAAVVDRGDWQTFSISVLEFTGNIMKHKGLAQSELEMMLVMGGVQMAICDLGKECSARSLQFAAMCVNSDDCQPALQGHMWEGLPAELKVRMQAYGAEIIAAMRRKDLDYFYGKP